MIKLSSIIAGGLTLVALGAQAGTLEDVRSHGTLSCGISTGLFGFAQQDAQGKWSGLDVDVCRAVAAAVFGDTRKVDYKPLNAKERFPALQSGEIDMLSRNTTWTYTRDTSLGLNFPGVNYYDGQGFMVPKKLGISSALELDGATVCIKAGTTTELNLADYFRTNGMVYKAITFDTGDQTLTAFENGHCDVLTSDQSQLYSVRRSLTDPKSAVVLPEVISKEPLGPAVRQGDSEWFNIVRWALFTMIEAEFLGIDSSNVDKIRIDGNPSQKRLVGVDSNEGEKLGLSADWAYNIIKQVGNYGESFERNVGTGSALQISRGLNAQWNKGGILYSPPVR